MDDPNHGPPFSQPLGTASRVAVRKPVTGVIDLDPPGQPHWLSGLANAGEQQEQKQRKG